MDSSFPDTRHLVVGGGVANPSRYPYFVRLDYSGYPGCGGTLVAPDMVLTAAHCAYDANVDVTDMALVRSSNDEQRLVRRVFPHPSYDDPSNRYDLAVLQMNDAMTTTIDNNETASFPSSLVSLQADTNHTAWQQDAPYVTVIGWGYTSDNSGVSNTLRQAVLQTVPDDECQLAYSPGDIHGPSMLCAAPTNATKAGPCYRDSGGPLLLLGTGDDDDNNDDVQVGIVSWGGSECAHPNEPSVYVDVAHIQPWVHRVVCQFSEAIPPAINCTGIDSLVNATSGEYSDDDTFIVVPDDRDDNNGAVASPSLSRPTRFSKQQWLVLLCLATMYFYV